MAGMRERVFVKDSDSPSARYSRSLSSPTFAKGRTMAALPAGSAAAVRNFQKEVAVSTSTRIAAATVMYQRRDLRRSWDRGELTWEVWPVNSSGGATRSA